MELNHLWLKLQRNLRRTSTLHIILLSVICHSLASILLIYLHLGWFLDNETSKYEPHGLTDKQGGVTPARRRHQVNLISSDVVDNGDAVLNQRGWWMDHTKWTVDIECFPQKWLLCSKSSVNRKAFAALYQFLPLKSDMPVDTVEFALRAKSRHLDEQGVENVYGLEALVSLSDGETEILKIEFPAEMDDWTRRSVKYTSPPGTQISDITVMLTCIGYLGLVSFTDIEVIPLPESNWNSYSKVIDHCARQPASESAVSEKYQTEHLRINGIRDSSSAEDIVTLVTQVSMDRLPVLEKTLATWTYPVSLAVYAPLKNVDEGIEEWQRFYIEKKIRNLKLPAGSKVALVTGSDDDNDYPINVLRNEAMKQAETKYIFLVDADFQSSPNLVDSFKMAATKRSSSRIAFVAPAFEYFEPPKVNDSLIRTKAELLQMVFKDDAILQPFRIAESYEAHSNTDYWKWYFAKENYFVAEFSDKYEPYVILEKQHAPFFDEQFTGYGMNKVTYINELFAAGYQFEVLHDAWLTHWPHKSTQLSLDFLQNTSLRLRNRAKRFHFIRKLALKYGLNRKWPECGNSN
ncbi:LARGE xylosyl- and glucuronyltransferase 2 [Halotydeus destructor]|nr:LARGE xylosyl- and glucuronyltransferase 2 [Halotydeus destructor]